MNEVSQALPWDGGMSGATDRALASQFRLGKSALPCGAGVMWVAGPTERCTAQAVFEMAAQACLPGP